MGTCIDGLIVLPLIVVDHGFHREMQENGVQSGENKRLPESPHASVAIGKRVAMGYLIAVVVYSVLTYIVYAVRYVKAKRSLKTYYGKLKKCGAMYAEEE